MREIIALGEIVDIRHSIFVEAPVMGTKDVNKYKKEQEFRKVRDKEVDRIMRSELYFCMFMASLIILFFYWLIG